MSRWLPFRVVETLHDVGPVPAAARVWSPYVGWLRWQGELVPAPEGSTRVVEVREFVEVIETARDREYQAAPKEST